MWFCRPHRAPRAPRPGDSNSSAQPCPQPQEAAACSLLPRASPSGRDRRSLDGHHCCADRSKHGHVVQSVGMAHAAWDTRNWLERCWLRPVAPSEWTSAAAQSGLGVGPEPVQLGMALSDEARSLRVCNARQRFLQTSHTKYGTGSRRPGTLRIRTLIGEAGCWLHTVRFPPGTFLRKSFQEPGLPSSNGSQDAAGLIRSPWRAGGWHEQRSQSSAALSSRCVRARLTSLKCEP